MGIEAMPAKVEYGDVLGGTRGVRINGEYVGHVMVISYPVDLGYEDDGVTPYTGEFDPSCDMLSDAFRVNEHGHIQLNTRNDMVSPIHVEMWGYGKRLAKALDDRVDVMNENHILIRKGLYGVRPIDLDSDFEVRRSGDGSLSVWMRDDSELERLNVDVNVKEEIQRLANDIYGRSTLDDVS